MKGVRCLDSAGVQGEQQGGKGRTSERVGARVLCDRRCEGGAREGLPWSRLLRRYPGPCCKRCCCSGNLANLDHLCEFKTSVQKVVISI